jgi:hypothetical protein
MRVAPMATAQIPPTVIRAASVEPGSARASTERDLDQVDQQQQPPVWEDLAGAERPGDADRADHDQPRAQEDAQKAT